jgi:outer membrane receptor for ferrienterochelin and colicin
VEWSGFAFARAFALRGTVSTGFRAPTLLEEYYSATNAAPLYAFAQPPPNSGAAQQFGIHKLEPEKSRNFSLGLVLHPLGDLTTRRPDGHDRTALSILEDGSPRYRFIAGALWTAGNRSMG